MKVSEILDKAADVIEANGHCKGGWYDFIDADTPPDECRVCAGGGMNVVATGDPVCDSGVQTVPAELQGAFEVLARRVGTNLPDPEDELPDDLLDAYITAVAIWNDADDRTAEEVVAELRAAAASAREDES